MKDTGIFWGGGYCIFHKLKSLIKNNKSAIYCLRGIFVIKFVDAETLRDFLGMLKKHSDI